MPEFFRGRRGLLLFGRVEEITETHGIHNINILFK